MSVLARSLHLDDPWLVGLMALAFGLRLFFWLYTGRTWEDALISVLHSENFYHGLGLTHFKIDDPRPLHGFTSPISVLAPLLADRFHVGWGLPFLKLLSLLAGPVTVWFGYRIMREFLAPLNRAAAVLSAGYLAIEHHQILWGMAGMETQLATAILLAAIYFLLAENLTASAILSGFCLLARPDFVIWVGIAAIVIAVGSIRRRELKPLAKFAALVAVIYGPWIVFTTLYYGSPIPNTIVAKRLGYVGFWETATSLRELLLTAARSLQVNVFTPLEPVFGGNGTLFIPLVRRSWLEELCLVVTLFGFIADLVRRRWRFLPVYAFTVLAAAFFVFRAPEIYGWYVVPLCGILTLLLGKGVADITAFLPRRLGRISAWLLTTAYLASFAVFLPTTFSAERNIQELIENRGRKAIGIYLSQTPLWTTIGGEPLGYIGYYSRRTYYDYPGLCSRKVVQWLQGHKYPRGYKELQVWEYLRPDYLVIRRFEYEIFIVQPNGAFLLNDYRLDREFSVPVEDQKKLFHPETNIDLDFLVLKKVKGNPE